MSQFLADHVWLHIAIAMFSGTAAVVAIDYIWRNRRP